MSKKDNFIVRSGKTGTVAKLPDGRRVFSLDREIFDKAINAANNYISERKSGSTDVKINVSTPSSRRGVG